MRKIDKIKIISYMILIICAFAIAGCGKKDEGDSAPTFSHSLNETNSQIVEDSEASTQESDDAKEEYRNQYLIMAINSADETMRVYRYANGLEYQYYYGMTTEFCNKYGSHTAVANFSAGDVVELSGTDEYGKLIHVQKSDDVWVYDDVSRFSFGGEGRVLTIADSNYKIDSETFIFSGNNMITPEEISEDDVLEVVGIEKKILSVAVTTGHGTLQLKNTELFEGSFMQLNKDIFTEITKDMKIDVPEGKYKLTVANNGWGGTKEIKIKRGKVTEVDLDEIKGEGPKTGRLLFEVDVPTARVFIDNNEIDLTQPIDLVYGAHSLVVMAEGYTSWSRTLYVNSEESTVIITLTDQQETTPAEATTPSESSEQREKDKDKTDKDRNKNTNTEKDTSSENEQNSGSDTEKTGTQQSADDILKDYMSTIADLFDSSY